MNKKAYIYISLICILSLVFGCFTAGANSITPGFGANPNSGTAYLVNQYTVDYDIDSTDNNVPHGNYSVATYEAYVNCFVNNISTDSYINGYVLGTVSITASTPSGSSISASNISFEGYNGNGYYVSAYNNSTGGSVTQIVYVRTYFDNFYSGNNSLLGLGRIKVSFSFTYQSTPNNVPDVPDRVYFSVSTNSGANCQGDMDPSDVGLVGIIEQSILNALNDQSMPFDDILDMLTNIRNINSDYFSAIVSYLNTTSIWEDAVEDWLSTIYSELALNTSYTQNIAMYSGQLQSLMSTFPQYSAQVLVLLGKLADMNAAQQTEAAAIESQYNSLQEQQDNADAVIEGVARPTFTQGQFSGNNLVSQGQRDTFTGFLALITGNSYITTILLIIVTFATAGFVLFGKKG